VGFLWKNSKNAFFTMLARTQSIKNRPREKNLVAHGYFGSNAFQGKKSLGKRLTIRRDTDGAVLDVFEGTLHPSFYFEIFEKKF
jgi:hypothetical protein